MKTFSYTELMSKTENELLIIKENKQEELYEINKRKLAIAGNIMYIQNLIDSAIKGIKNETENL